MDETYVGGVWKGKRGRGTEGKTLVIIAAEHDGERIGRIRLVQVPDQSGQSFEKAVSASVKSGSTVRTDGLKSYNGLKRLGYQHEIVRKTETLGDNLLPRCHRVASLMKRWLLGTHQGAVSHEHLDYYLDEFTFRFNRRTSRHRGILFYRLLQQAIATEPATYRVIIKPSRNMHEN